MSGIEMMLKAMGINPDEIRKVATTVGTAMQEINRNLSVIVNQNTKIQTQNEEILFLLRGVASDTKPAATFDRVGMHAIGEVTIPSGDLMNDEMHEIIKDVYPNGGSND